jgi:hypothetical protein
MDLNLVLLDEKVNENYSQIIAGDIPGCGHPGQKDRGA